MTPFRSISAETCQPDRFNISRLERQPRRNVVSDREALSMIGRDQHPSVADMMRKHSSPAEALLIKSAWTPRTVLKDEGRARPN